MRDNIHASDVVRAFATFHAAPRAGSVYNLGGGRDSNISMIEAIALCERIAGRKLDYTRKQDYPPWKLTFGIEEVLRDIYEKNVEAWAATSR